MEGYTIKSVLFVIEGQWSMHSRINSSKEIKEQDEKAKKVVISLYELLQAEEENFIKMSKSVFGKSLTKELGKNSFRTEQKRLGVSKSFIKVFAEIYTRWEPPVTHW